MLEFISPNMQYQKQSCEVWRGCYAPILQMKKIKEWEMQGKFDEHIDITSGHPGLLASVDFALGWHQP